MPRRREKTRTDRLADALEAHLKSGEALSHIDLRSCAGDLRETVKRIRVLHAELAKELAQALKEDALTTPKRTRG